MTTTQSERKIWYSEARRVAEDYQRILGKTTKFPRAGEQNVLVNRFVDLCVALWERGGCDEKEAEWVIAVSHETCDSEERKV
jgi:hypothetical protein